MDTHWKFGDHETSTITKDQSYLLVKSMPQSVEGQLSENASSGF